MKALSPLDDRIDQSDNAIVLQQDLQGNTGVDDPAKTTVTLTLTTVGSGGTNFFGGVTGTAYRTED